MMNCASPLTSHSRRQHDARCSKWPGDVMRLASGCHEVDDDMKENNEQTLTWGHFWGRQQTWYRQNPSVDCQGYSYTRLQVQWEAHVQWEAQGRNENLQKRIHDVEGLEAEGVDDVRDPRVLQRLLECAGEDAHRKRRDVIRLQNPAIKKDDDKAGGGRVNKFR